MDEWYGMNAMVAGTHIPCPIANNTKLLNRRVGGLMFKRSRIALLFGVAVAVSLIISACGGSSTTTGSTPTAAATVSTLGTPGSFNCVQGQITASGSTALAPLVKAVAQQYSTKCPGATITVNLGGSKTGLANAEAGSVNIGNSDVPAGPTQTDLVD